MKKIKISKEDKEMLLGLLPFSSETTEDFTPKHFDKIPDAYKPVFVLKPWNIEQKNRYKAIANKMSTLKEGQLAEQSNKLSDEIMKIVCESVVDIKNLINLGTLEIDSPKMDGGHVAFEFMDDILPEALKGDIHRRVLNLSGLTLNEKLGL